MTESILSERQLLWRRKPVLREIYNDLYERMVQHAVEGKTLEIGGGSGDIKTYIPDAITTDILFTPWLNAVTDAQSLPFADNSFGNIVMFDVLHHIEQPGLFFSEAQRVLQPGGRVIMMEPMITPVSWVFYTYFHPEDVDMSQDPLEKSNREGKAAFDANQAIPTWLFFKNKERFSNLFPMFELAKLQRLSLFSYPLSGGFRPWSLLPSKAVKSMLSAEDYLLPLLGPLMAFRMLVVLERTKK